MLAGDPGGPDPRNGPGADRPGAPTATSAIASVDSGLRMRTVVAPVEGNKVKLSIEVDEQEFERSIDAAYRKIAREVRIPGFRPGKAPRRILEARLGANAGRAEALRDSLPDYYAKALRETAVDAIAPPEIDITAGEESGGVTFDAVVEVRPQLALAGYDSLQVTVPSPEVTDEDIAGQIDRMRTNFATLEVVDRPAESGDNLTIDLTATRDGVALDNLVLSDYSYVLGSGEILAEVDEALPGAKVGDTVAFDASFGGAEEGEKIQVEVVVKEVKAVVLPDLTDEWADEASEFATVDELRADVAKRMAMVKKVQATMGLRNGAVEALVQLVDIDAPEPLVNAEIERRAHDLGHRLEQQGATIAQYLQATGQTEEQVVGDLRAAAVPAVKADLALRAVAEAEHLDPTDAEIEAEIERLAPAYGVDADRLRASLEQAEQMPVVRADLKKNKALEWVLEHIDVVDPEGRAVDRALLSPEALASAAADAGAQSDAQADAGTDTGDTQPGAAEPTTPSESGEA
jgi:trigger factor